MERRTKRPQTHPNNLKEISLKNNNNNKVISSLGNAYQLYINMRIQPRTNRKVFAAFVFIFAGVSSVHLKEYDRNY